MKDDTNLDNHPPKDRKNKKISNLMLFVIIASWLLFYLYTGSKGGVG
jgi:hypothetical protein